MPTNNLILAVAVIAKLVYI